MGWVDLLMNVGWLCGICADFPGLVMSCVVPRLRVGDILSPIPQVKALPVSVPPIKTLTKRLTERKSAIVGCRISAERPISHGFLFAAFGFQHTVAKAATIAFGLDGLHSLRCIC